MSLDNTEEKLEGPIQEDTDVEKIAAKFFEVNAKFGEIVDGLTSSKLKTLIKNMSLYPYKMFKEEDFNQLSKKEQAAYHLGSYAKDLFMNLMFLGAKEKLDDRQKMDE